MGIEWSIRELMLSAEVQGPKNGSLELGHNAVDRERWVDSRNILQTEMAGVVDKVGVEWGSREEKGKLRMTLVFLT